MKLLLTGLTFIALVGCGKSVTIKAKPYPFIIPNSVPPVEVRIHPHDTLVYKAYINALRKRSDVLIMQINDYQENFK